SIGHMLAHAQTMEAFLGNPCQARAKTIRAILLELERIANHIGDLGALANDVAFLPTSSFCGRIRGDFLNLSAFICGNRFGRRAIVPGGCAYDFDGDMIKEFIKRIRIFFAKAEDAIELLFETASVLNRFENCGVVGEQTAIQLGLVGPPARACGLSRDIRYSHPSGKSPAMSMPVCESGDVYARAFIRWMEVKNSYSLILSYLDDLKSGAVISHKSLALPPDSLALSLVEGWRGEICHAAITDSNGKFKRYKVVDPSFHNWSGLEAAMKNELIYNFPLCNKSFNLSYCGFDL
nr:hypothetical protein [Victivallales bacterium]